VLHCREKTNIYRFLVQKHEGKRPIGRTRHRWVDNIKMHIRVHSKYFCGGLHFLLQATYKDVKHLRHKQVSTNMRFRLQIIKMWLGCEKMKKKEVTHPELNIRAQYCERRCFLFQHFPKFCHTTMGTY